MKGDGANEIRRRVRAMPGRSEERDAPLHEERKLPAFVTLNQRHSVSLRLSTSHGLSVIHYNANDCTLGATDPIEELCMTLPTVFWDWKAFYLQIVASKSDHHERLHSLVVLVCYHRSHNIQYSNNTSRRCRDDERVYGPEDCENAEMDCSWRF